jgi:hypothetical protein
MRTMLAMNGVLILLASSTYAARQCPAGYNDEHGIDVKGDTAFGEASNQQPGGCTAQSKNGLPVPDMK